MSVPSSLAAAFQDTNYGGRIPNKHSCIFAEYPKSHLVSSVFSENINVVEFIQRRIENSLQVLSKSESGTRFLQPTSKQHRYIIFGITMLARKL